MRSAQGRRRRYERGSVAHYVVFTMAVSLAGVVLASEGTIASFARDERRLAASDEAFALAESGVAFARRALERDSPALPADPRDATSEKLLDREPLGRGTITVDVERWIMPDGKDTAVVVATGTVAAPLVAGPGGTITRRIEVRLERALARQPSGRETPAPGPMVVVGWKEL